MKATLVILWALAFMVATLGIFVAAHLFIPAGVLLGCAAIFTGVYYTDNR